MGIVANMINRLVMRRLPRGHKHTEIIEREIKQARCRLCAELDDLLFDLIGASGEETRGPVSD